MVEDELVEGGSTDVQTWESIARGLIEVHAETSLRFVSEELKDDER